MKFEKVINAKDMRAVVTKKWNDSAIHFFNHVMWPGMQTAVLAAKCSAKFTYDPMTQNIEPSIILEIISDYLKQFDYQVSIRGNIIEVLW